MKILVVHNAYQKYGGEDAVFRNEVELLRENGHEVHTHLVSNDAVDGLFAKIKAALGVIFSLSAYREISGRIRSLRPDVVHVHNFFPLISPAVFYACRREGVPSVMTAHNYRIMCPTAILMHDGKICERSLQEGPWWAVRARVYRGSRLGTLVLALMIVVHRRLGTWRKVLTRLVVLTDFSRRKFMAWGIPEERLRIKPNFYAPGVAADVETLRHENLPDEFVLYVGRLSAEKGILVLRDAWKDLDIPLVVVGEGEEAGHLSGQPGIHVLGKKQPAEVMALMAKSRFIVMPSLWYEGFPMTLVEAMAVSLPSVVSGLGSLQEIVRDGVTGLHAEPGSPASLAATVQRLFDDKELCRTLGQAAYEEYRNKYTAQANYHALMAVYEDAIAHV